MTRLSIRAQVVLLISLLLTAAMALYLTLATRIVTRDKEATVYDVNALVAGAVADQVETTVDGFTDKLRYFGQEYASTPGDAERRAKSLFSADDEVLSLEVDTVSEAGVERAFLFVDADRLSTLNIEREDILLARKQTPVPFDVVRKSGVLLQNASLAPDLALLRLSVVTADGKAIITADLRPERLLRTVNTGSVTRVFLVDAIGRVLAHRDASKVIAHEDFSGLTPVKSALSGKAARGAEQYDGEGEQRLASYARVGQGLAAVVAEVPVAEVFGATRELSSRSFLFAAGIVALALVLAVFLSRALTAPLRRLSDTMAVISKGEYGVEVPVEGAPEIRSVGTALNEMSRELIRRSDDLQRAHNNLVQSEKLSAVGELAASVAHEVKNPMVGILGFAQLGKEADTMVEAKEYFGLIESDTQRANKILQNLLEFARPPEMEMEPLVVNEVLQGALTLCRHQLQMQGVKVETAFGDGLGGILGNNNQLRQVLLNLMMNAGQAMAESPTKRVTVATAADGDFVKVLVSDTGPGIPPEVMQNLFKPFFTTKRRGLGTGLGLSVSRSIIEAHRGTLTAESTVGQGATFIMRLPVKKS
ncbi:MAG: HAMP domain-containing protein [Archangiaceae bacterium]|nr:HAMP domain-containing protein [Archangiaceae bacterium]